MCRATGIHFQIPLSVLVRVVTEQTAALLALVLAAAAVRTQKSRTNRFLRVVLLPSKLQLADQRTTPCFKMNHRP
jgi:hypothetical protein